jgi:hypothetical protein
MVEEIFARFIRLLDAAQKGMVISDGPTQR